MINNILLYKFRHHKYCNLRRHSCHSLWNHLRHGSSDEPKLTERPATEVKKNQRWEEFEKWLMAAKESIDSIELDWAKRN
jgi:hypothetical protein